MAFDNPYTNFHEINLNKFLKAIKNLLGGHGGEYLQKKSNIPFDYEWVVLQGGQGAVDSVNGKTGVVVLDAADVGALPDSTVIPDPANATPADLGTAAIGSSTRYARQDHVHKMPSAADVGLGNVDNVQQYSATNPPPYPVTSVNGQTGAVTVSGATPADTIPEDLGTAAIGTSDKFARQDHVHNMPSAADVGALPDNTVIPDPANANPSDLGTAAIGSTTRYARQDHVHKMPSAADVGALPDSTVIPDPANATPADLGTAAIGSSTRYARQDHVHNLPSVFSTVDFKTFTVPANGSVTISMTALSGAVVFISGYQAGRNGIVDMGTTSGGNAFQSKVNASSVTVSTSGGTVTIGGGNAILQCLMIVYAGSATVN